MVVVLLLLLVQIVTSVQPLLRVGELLEGCRLLLLVAQLQLMPVGVIVTCATYSCPAAQRAVMELLEIVITVRHFRTRAHELGRNANCRRSLLLLQSEPLRKRLVVGGVKVALRCQLEAAQLLALLAFQFQARLAPVPMTLARTRRQMLEALGR